jgi:hypothetical protein
MKLKKMKLKKMKLKKMKLKKMKTQMKMKMVVFIIFLRPVSVMSSKGNNQKQSLRLALSNAKNLR